MRKGKIIVAGPFADDKDERGMAIFRTSSLEEAKALFAADPKVQAGHLISEWYAWLVPEGLLPE